MHVKQLKLERFRGADNLTLDLDARLNVFVGMNGAGKSTVLDATAILLSWFVNRIRSPRASGRQIGEADIRNGESSCNLTIETHSRDNVYRWNLAKIRPGHSRKNIGSDLGDASKAADQVQSTTKAHKEVMGLPLIAYYPVNRAVLDIPLRIRTKHKFSLLAAYDESLTSGANFRIFFEWFRETEDLENEAKLDPDSVARARGVEALQDPQLKAVRMALSQFMPEFGNWRVRRNPLRMEVDKSGQRLTVNQLSDGEKCLMAMVGDLARRMAIANPSHVDPLTGEGIILIDEIDMHLHPQWQHLLIAQLTKVFPRCQFLISTHSPHVITHVRPENLFRLTVAQQRLEALPAHESYGKTVERVLEDLMGLETTRPAAIKASLRQIYQRIDRSDLQQAKLDIDALRSEIGADPELIRASVLIKRKELIGK